MYTMTTTTPKSENRNTIPGHGDCLLHMAEQLSNGNFKVRDAKRRANQSLSLFSLLTH